MAWTSLPTNYTDAVWTGLRKYTQQTNSDGTISFNDVTEYTNRENSFFGAKDANAMNEAMNYIMEMLESGTDLYSEFTTYFATQKTLFEKKGGTTLDTVLADLEGDFDTWFATIKDKLDGDSAGKLNTRCDDMEVDIADLESNQGYLLSTDGTKTSAACKALSDLETYTSSLDTDEFVVGRTGTKVLGKMTLSTFAAKIINSRLWSDLKTTTKTILGAINELVSSVSDLTINTGDTFTISNVSIGAGYTSSTTVVYMTFPINKPISSAVTKVSVSNLKCRVLQNGKYLFGSTSSAMVTPSSVSAAITKGVGVRLVITFSSSTNATALMACGVQIESGLKFTFS